MVVLPLCELRRQLVIRRTSFSAFQFMYDSSLGQVISVQLLPNVSDKENVLTEFWIETLRYNPTKLKNTSCQRWMI